MRPRTWPRSSFCAIRFPYHGRTQLDRVLDRWLHAAIDSSHCRLSLSMTSLLLPRLVIERFNSRPLLVPGLFAIAVSIGSSSAAAQSTSFGPQEEITTSADLAQSVYATDLDGDGDADVLSASFFDDKIAWYENSPPVNVV